MMIMRHIAHAFGRRRPELAASRDMTQRTLNWNTNARVVRDGKSMAKANGLITICAALHLSPASPHSWTIPFCSATPQSVAEGLWHASSAAPLHLGRSFHLRHVPRLLMPPPCCASARGSSQDRPAASLTSCLPLQRPHQGLTSEQHATELTHRSTVYRGPCLGCSSPQRAWFCTLGSCKERQQRTSFSRIPCE